MNVGGRECVLGFDWAVYQTPRDLRAARNEGHRFAVIKATEGEGFTDPKYYQHVANVMAAGLLNGAYHFARPSKSGSTSPWQDGRNEARWFLSVIHAQTDFVVLDLEATAVSPGETTEFVDGWFHEIVLSGRFPIREQRVLYVGHYFNWQHATSVRDVAVLWVPAYTAGYNPNPDPCAIALPLWAKDLWPEGWSIWQYTSSGTVAGTHPSDMNVATVQWVNSVQSRTSLRPPGYDNIGEWSMRPIAIQGEGAQYELVVDGFGNRRRRGIATQAEANMLGKAGAIAGQDQVLVLTDPAEIDAFRSIPDVGLGGPPVLADMGALTLAVETWKRLDNILSILSNGAEHLPPVASPETNADEIAKSVRRIHELVVDAQARQNDAPAVTEGT